MLCETDIEVSWRARPQGFVALMSLYESNYLRFLRLAGDPARLSGTLISSVAGDCQLQLAVIEHMRYTSSLALTYLLPQTAPVPATLERLPDLRLRAYHDARLLEVEALQQPVQKKRPSGADGSQFWRRAPGERELHQRWMRNMMLNKWLEYCADRGHRFTG
jgi:uncharacterized protein YqiB (DUF1249 family)